MPIMAKQPNGEYIELCVIPSWINGIRNDISEIKLPTDERIFKNWRTYEGTLPVTLSHTGEGNLMSYKIWGNTGGVGVKKTNLAEGEQLLRNASMGSDGTIVTTSSNFAFRLIPVVEGREYSVVNIYGAETSVSSNFYAFFEELPQIGSVSYNERRYSFKTPSRTFIAPITGYLATSDYYPMYDEQHENLIPLEVYEGNASPYYLPMVSSSETTNIYIGRAALEKGEHVDSVSGKIYKAKPNLVTDVLNRSFVNSSGVIATSNTANLAITPIEKDKTYTILYARNTAFMSCGFFEQYPTLGSVAFDDSRFTFTSDYYTFTAPINGYLASSFEPDFTAICFAGEAPYLQPTDPPEPLPEISTFAGSTAISYGGTGVQPEKVELKYKLKT